MKIPSLALILVIVLFTAGQVVHADDDSSRQRIEFIEDRLDEGRADAMLWQNGWTSVYAGVALVQGTLAFTSDEHDDRVKNSVGALRAIAALTLMRIRPDPGRHGAGPIRSAGPEGSTQRLYAAENLLRRLAHHAAQRNSPKRHFLNLGINAFFGGLIWAFGDLDDAIQSTLLGIVGGEAALLTRSQQPIRNLDDYGSRFAARIAWQLVPVAGGIAFRARF
jgi:hypothetical protein